MRVNQVFTAAATRTAPFALLIFAILLSGPTIAGDRLPVFTGMSLEEARAAAQERDQLLVVYGTAEWCPPCQAMKQTVWVDPGVTSWIDRHAIVYELDVDEESAASEALDIEAMPTMIAYKDGKEIDRIVGGQSTDDLLRWMERADRGMTHADWLRERAGGRAGPDGKVDVRARMDLAKQLATNDGQPEQATEEYLWLWDNMLDHEPHMLGVRRSFMVRDMQSLASMYAPARDAFARVRDREEDLLRAGETSWDRLADWIALNKVTNENNRTIAWVDRRIADPDSHDQLRRLDFAIDDLLMSNRRWDAMEVIYPDMLAHAQQVIAITDRLDARRRHRESLPPERRYRSVRSQLAKAHTIAIATGQTDAALEIVELARAKQDTPFMVRGIAAHAHSHEVLHPSMLVWLKPHESDPMVAAIIAEIRDTPWEDGGD